MKSKNESINESIATNFRVRAGIRSNAGGEMLAEVLGQEDPL